MPYLDRVIYSAEETQSQSCNKPTVKGSRRFLARETGLARVPARANFARLIVIAQTAAYQALENSST